VYERRDKIEKYNLLKGFGDVFENGFLKMLKITLRCIKKQL